MHQVTGPYSPTVPSGRILVPKYLQSRKVSTAYLWNMAYIGHCAWEMTKALKIFFMNHIVSKNMHILAG